MRMGSLLFQFRNNDTAHDDMHVWIEGFSCIADSYYFALEPPVLANDRSPNNVRRILIRLLQLWMDAIAQATPTRMVYLPFDFSDEYTGCFRCRPDGDFIEITPGFSMREGWRVKPRNPGDYFFGVNDFQTDAPAPIRLPTEEFLRRIRESISDTEAQLPEARKGRGSHF